GPAELHTFIARRGNHEVMMRGTFLGGKLVNEMVGANHPGHTFIMPERKLATIYDAAMHYQEAQTPVVVVAGKEYGTGWSRDWAAKGTRLLGVQAVLAESFERIHRSNLVNMGILPLQFPAGVTRHTLEISAESLIDLEVTASLEPNQPLD